MHALTINILILLLKVPGWFSLKWRNRHLRYRKQVLQILHFMGTKFRPLPIPPDPDPCFPPPPDLAIFGVEVRSDFCELFVADGNFKVAGDLVIVGDEVAATMLVVTLERQLRQRWVLVAEYGAANLRLHDTQEDTMTPPGFLELE